MGACTFSTVGRGKTAAEAFDEAVSAAQWENASDCDDGEDCDSGYSGTIAEKSSFKIITCPAEIDPRDYARQLIDRRDPRVDDKWGPAGCIKLGEGEYLFFGWASS